MRIIENKKQYDEVPHTLCYQGNQKEGQPLDPKAISFVENWYGQDWNNYHEVAAEEISDIIKHLDDLLNPSMDTRFTIKVNS